MDANFLKDANNWAELSKAMIKGVESLADNMNLSDEDKAKFKEELKKAKVSEAEKEINNAINEIAKLSKGI